MPAADRARAGADKTAERQAGATALGPCSLLSQARGATTLLCHIQPAGARSRGPGEDWEVRTDMTGAQEALVMIVGGVGEKDAEILKNI